MKIRALSAGILLPILFIGGILITTATGYWMTESSKQPVKFETGEFAGESNPGDIRGSYSFSDLEKVFGIPVETLAKAYGFSDVEVPEDVKIKEFEEIYASSGDMEVGTDSMRLFVALYKGLPFEPEETTALPEPAFNILRKEGASSDDVLQLYESRRVSLSGFISDGVETEVEHSEEKLSGEIKGGTLFSELLDWGLSREQIEEVLGTTMGAPAMSVRDFCIDQGIEFSTVKTPIQELLDSI
ncbi:MAG: hypothetical protein JEY99_18115 [Spirochaetales bacterium]|nr:hypothetical protein [Spirochaetales bacterium]